MFTPSRIKWLALALGVLVTGTLLSFSAARYLDLRASHAWQETAREEAERLTEISELSLRRVETGLLILAQRLAPLSLDETERFSAKVSGSLRHIPSIGFENVVFRPFDSCTVGVCSEIRAIQNGPSLNDFASLQNVVGRGQEDTAFLGSGFKSADGRIKATMMTRASLSNNPGLLAAVFDIEAYFLSMIRSAVPDGLILRITEYGVPQSALIGDEEPVPGALATFSFVGETQGSQWLYEWDLLPSYKTAYGDSPGAMVRIGGPIVFLITALGILIVAFVNGRTTAVAEVRSKELTFARDQAERANRTKSEFLANMSHELRTPLNAIIGFSEILEGQLLGPDEWRKYRVYASDIRQSGRHLLRLINDLLDLSKAEAGAITLEEDYVQPKDLIEGAVRLVHERARNAGLDLSVEGMAEAYVLYCDELRVKQILLNLLANAVKFTPRNGVVKVGATMTQDGRLRFYVTDTGIGIEEKAIPTALAKFGQVNRDPSKLEAGTGLGLPLASKLTTLHQGEMTLESVAGQGTTVSILFPETRVDLLDTVFGSAQAS